MPPVTITIDQNNKFNVSPPVAITKPTDLTVEWNIINNGTLTLLNPPIVFPWPVPAGVTPVDCSSWTRFTGTVEAGSGPHQWKATFPPLPPFNRRCYKYSVAYQGGAYDPEVENQGVPPMAGADWLEETIVPEEQQQ